MFLHKVANRQTDKQRRKHNLLGGGNELIDGTEMVQVTPLGRTLTLSP